MYSKNVLRIIFVGIQNHCDNVKRIIEAYNDKFIGERDLLRNAGSKHDQWKRNTLNPKVIINGKGSLFYGHGSEFPSYLVSKFVFKSVVFCVRNLWFSVIIEIFFI